MTRHYLNYKPKKKATALVRLWRFCECVFINNDYNNASNPFLSRISNSLHEGPPGFFVPASQARTVAALVLMMMANAA